jgi:hypothetical protein
MFCLLLPVIETLIAEFPSVLILGFVDDYYFLGDTVDCAAAYRRYGELLRERGQELGSGGGKNWCYSLSQATLDSDAVTGLVNDFGCRLAGPEGGIVVLGSPVGARTWTREHLRSHVARVSAEIDHVVSLARHSHAAAAQSAFSCTARRQILRSGNVFMGQRCWTTYRQDLLLET